MTEDQKDLLEEARESISAADLLLMGGYPGYAVSRAYYAMFYLSIAGLGWRAAVLHPVFLQLVQQRAAVDTQDFGGA